MSKVITERSGQIYIVYINRPEVKNAIDEETGQLLFDAFKVFEENDEFKVAILTGSGNTFCAGADLKAISTNVAEAPQLQHGGRAPLGVSRMQLSKPVIAAVEGHAVAGGLEIALWCDLRVAADDAVFGVYCRRFGVPLVDGGTVRLPRLIGHSHAIDLILTGRSVYSNEAKTMGLVNRIVPRGEALEHAKTLAMSLTRFPQTCMRNDRRSVYDQWGKSETEALDIECKWGLETLASKETFAGAARFTAGKGRHGDFEEF